MTRRDPAISVIRLRAVRCSRRRFLLGAAAATLLSGCGSADGQLTLSSTPPPTVANYDLIVYGANLAGTMAALRASLHGHRVCVLEPTGTVGGAIAAGLGSTDLPLDQSLLQGMTRSSFYVGIGARYGSQGPLYAFEPSVAEAVTAALLQQARATLILNAPVDGPGDVYSSAGRLLSIRTSHGWIRGSFFVDASYEGDLMAATGTPYTVGREGSDVYDETYAGFYPRGADHAGGLVPNTGYPVGPQPETDPGEQDQKTQAYRFSCVLTNRASNQIPFPRPADYDASLYALVLQEIEAQGVSSLLDVVGAGTVAPNGKVLIGRGLLVSSELPGASWAYPDASWAARRPIVARHLRWQQGLYHWLATDPGVPAVLRADAATWGLPADEFVNGPHGTGWPGSLHVKEGRRLIGAYVLTEKDQFGTGATKDTSICQWSHERDCGVVQLYPNGRAEVVGEGPLTGAKPVDTYQIPAECLFPKSRDLQNLAVAVCFSASHVGYSSTRFEPVYGMIGEACGELASLCIERHLAAQDYPYDDLASRLIDGGSSLF